jgi:hypothetical protein
LTLIKPLPTPVSSTFLTLKGMPDVAISLRTLRYTLVKLLEYSWFGITSVQGAGGTVTETMRSVSFVHP